MTRAIAALTVASLALAGCGEAQPPAHLRIAGADPERGRSLVRHYGCGVCHTIEGVRGARGVVGPPLLDYAGRQLLAGLVPNTPRHLVPWLIDPTALAPGTGMPDLGIREAEARDIAAFLYAAGADAARVYPPETLPLARDAEGSPPPLRRKPAPP